VTKDEDRPARADQQPLAQRYDVALVDLDGVVRIGDEAVPGAVEALRSAEQRGMRLCYVTNNASRTPQQVAARLRRLGCAASAGQVATSAQAVATLLGRRLGAPARVLVVGAEGLRAAVLGAGFDVVETVDDRPAAVAQGYSDETTYDDLARACLAIRAGALWVASNADPTMPSPRGQLPGNGALLAAVATATGRQPIVAGKPELALHAEAIARSGARRPLVVGDRLDTDVRGAVRAQVDSLLVLTGVTGPDHLRDAGADCRPTFVARGLGGLLRPLVPIARYDGNWPTAVDAALSAAGSDVPEGEPAAGK
jgi:HAD superfamily hydrolase (TIGR01450 family)